MSLPTILNTSILTNDGEYKMETITLAEATEMVQGEFQSAIGHTSTANILTTLLGVKVERNRIMYSQEVGDVALVFKLNGRPEEGVILSVEDINNIGYTFKKLVRCS